jgi:hypothetical protein
MSLSQDQYKFLMANLAGLSLALPYRYIPRSFRNEFNYLPGVLMVYYCFGRQANTLVLFSTISYAICRFTHPKYVGRLSLCTSLAFLSYAHLSRQIIDYGGYVLDISGPFMIAVQKMTSLGFCLYDGYLKRLEDDASKDSDSGTTPKAEEKNNDDNNNDNCDSIQGETCSLVSKCESISSGGTSVIGTKIRDDVPNLTEEQRKYAVTKTPCFNEFMGYFFHFPSVLCGPIMYYNDYSDFVNAPEDKALPPGRHKAVARKLTISLTCAILHLTLNPRFEVEFLRSQEFLVQTPLLMRFVYIIIFTMLSRLKYYVAWHLGEAISNAAGLGFNGYESDGKPKWNLISNMNLWKFETCLNFREAIHAWNKTTQSWLRRTAYERAPRRLSVLATYLLSAVWHGFYPGYYMTFLGGALFTYSARNGRHFIRPLFQRGKLLPKIYDVITFILTRVAIAYVAFPFVILDFRNNFEIYKSLYFSVHVLALGGLLLGFLARKKRNVN